MRVDLGEWLGWEQFVSRGAHSELTPALLEYIVPLMRQSTIPFKLTGKVEGGKLVFQYLEGKIPHQNTKRV